MSKSNDRLYEVGKGKPPTASQWKPGQSGNPKGRRPRKRAEEATIAVLFQEAINEPVEVTIGGRIELMPKKQAIVIGVVNDALQGTPAQRLKALAMLEKVGAFDATIVDERQTPQEREAALAGVVEQLAEEFRQELARGVYPPEYDPGPEYRSSLPSTSYWAKR